MSYQVICISRQFGSGGRTIGKAVAQRLNIPCYDQELVELLAARSGFSKEYIAEVEEHSLKRTFTGDYAEKAVHSPLLQASVRRMQEQVIRDLARQGPCVIIGRCAGHILRHSPDCLRVYIHAEEGLRAQRIVSVYGETADAPLKRIRDKDRRRKEYYQHHTGLKWGNAENFHIALDSGALGQAACVDILAAVYAAGPASE